MAKKQKDMPLMLLNWNTLTGNSNLTNGEYFRAGIIFKQLLDINEKFVRWVIGIMNYIKNMVS